MTAAARGQTKTLTAFFYEYAGGPPTNVVNLTVEITRVEDGVVVLAETSTGVMNIGTGAYRYSWDVSIALPLGDYLVEWAHDAGSATETVTVVEAGSATGSGPCDTWPILWGSCDLETISPSVTGDAVQAATEILWSLSGQRFGLCTVTLRPCRRECSGMPWPSGTGWPSVWPGLTYPLPVWHNGVWLNLTCGGCSSGCSCSSVSEVVLPGPVASVIEVMIDGVELSPSSYRVDDSRLLVRTDGSEWPSCNDLAKDDGEVGTWSVTAQFGESVPTIGKMAMGELVCEFAKALGGDECALPQLVTSLVRQGVSLTMLDPNEALENGRIGLRLTDLFLSTYNPGGLRSRSAVYDVDGSRLRRTGTA